MNKMLLQMDRLRLMLGRKKPAANEQQDRWDGFYENYSFR
jgi:hypothetical protein